MHKKKKEKKKKKNSGMSKKLNGEKETEREFQDKTVKRGIEEITRKNYLNTHKHTRVKHPHIHEGKVLNTKLQDKK